MSSNKGVGKLHPFTEGQRIFAKVRGYPHWPARIQKIDSSKKLIKYHVLFYGTYETAVLKADSVFDYEESKEKYGIQRDRRFFNEALKEIENPNVSPPVSSGSKKTKATQLKDKQAAEPTSTAVLSDSMLSKKRKLSETDVSTPVSETTPKSKPLSKSDQSLKEVVLPPNEKVKAAVKKSAEIDTSRKLGHSGRQIKPKKFADEYDVSESDLDDSLEKSKYLEDGDYASLVDVCLNAKNGQVASINANVDKPSSFESDEANYKWETERCLKIRKAREMLESGEISPEKIHGDIKKRELFTSLKESEVDKREEELKQLHLQLLRQEEGLVAFDYKIKQSLRISDPKPEQCANHLQELQSMTVSPLMLKKNPAVLSTLFKCQNYTPDNRVREAAKKALQKLRSLFVVPEGMPFEDFFSEQLEIFEEKTRDWEENRKLFLVEDPTSST